MLSAIMKLLVERGPMSLSELSIHFHMESSAMDGMLSTLLAKGRIEKVHTQCSGCKGCKSVKPEDAAIYKAVTASAIVDLRKPGCQC